jgi:hypothetical protein
LALVNYSFIQSKFAAGGGHKVISQNYSRKKETCGRRPVIIVASNCVGFVGSGFLIANHFTSH